MRRALAVSPRAVALAMALAGPLLGVRPAGAQVPLEAGSSFGTAPVLAPGTYVDTIQALEELYVAVDLADGQRLRATATVVGQPEGPDGYPTFVGLGLYDPDRSQGESAEALFDGRADATAVLAVRRPVGTGAGADPPGRYFVRLELRVVGNSPLVDRDYDYRLAIEVEQDRPAVRTTTRPTPTTTAGSPPTTAPGPGATEADGRGAPVAAGLASFVLGAAGGGVVMGIRRRVTVPPTPAPPEG